MSVKSRGLASMACISASAAFLVGGYEFSRNAMASLFLDRFGSGSMPYAMAVVPVLMAVFIYGYGRLLTRLGSQRTLLVSLGASAAVFVGAYPALCSGSKAAVAALYVFTEAYIVILIEQFWSFINSTLDQGQAKVFNGPILGGAAIGPLLAGLALRYWASSLGSERFVLFSGLTLIPAAVLAAAAYHLAGEPKPAVDEKGGRFGALHLGLIFEHRVLLFIALVVGLSQCFATAANLRLYEILEVAMPGKDARTAYLGSFWFMVNCFVFLMQFVVTPLLLKRLPLKVVLIGIPLVNMCAAVFMLSSPSLGVAAGALLLFNVMEYSVLRAGNELLYIPLSFDARYRAKQVVDAFTYRFSKGAAAGLISAARALMGGLPGWTYPAVCLASAVSWAAAAAPLARSAGKSK